MQFHFACWPQTKVGTSPRHVCIEPDTGLRPEATGEAMMDESQIDQAARPHAAGDQSACLGLADFVNFVGVIIRCPQSLHVT